LYKYRWGLRPKTKQYAPSADLGTLYHKLKQKGPDKVTEVRQYVRQIQDKLVEQIENGQDMTGDLARTASALTALFDKALVMAQIFWEAYPLNPKLVTLCKEETIEAEVCGIPAKGILDHIQVGKETGNVWIRDEKSSGLPFEDIYTGYEFSIQCRWYRLLAEAWLVRGIWKEPAPVPLPYTITGFILDYMMTPGIKFGEYDRDFYEYDHTFTRGKRKGEVEKRKEYSGEPKFENYIKRAKQWYQDNMDSKPIRSMAIVFSEPAMPPELEQDLATIRMLHSMPLEIQFFPRDITRSYCRAYKKTCVFYELCSSDERIWPDIISRLYTTGNLDHQEKEENRNE
jgi:hypothetical protein